MNRKLTIILHDLFMTIVAWQGAWWLRFNLDFFLIWHTSLYSLPVVLLVQIILFHQFKLYKGIWRFASLADLWNIFRAGIAGAFCITLTFFLWNRLADIPRSILVLYPVLLIFFLGGSRLAYRLWKDFSWNASTGTRRKIVLVVGAGAAAEMLVRDMLRENNLQVTAIVDDDPKLFGSEIHGVEVIGKIADIPQICEQRHVDLIIIAISLASNQQMQTIVTFCERTDCIVRTLPSIQDTITGKVTINELREIRIEDLLGRERIRLDWASIRKGINDQCILVTGGGGSIGSELCRQIASLSPASLIVLDCSEYNLYRIEKNLAKYDIKTYFVLGNICDEVTIEKILSTYKPNVIYHAAAYKHVPILQHQPYQAIRNNILGTKNMVDVAGKYECDRFVLISTDKAVNPTNVLGLSKRIAEMYMEVQNGKHRTKFMTVRFGNVLDSEGSVVPLFREQIKAGGPVTVTHSEITRYFMTISEACQLIMQASAMSDGGEIFVLDMGEPIKIGFLAEQMIRLSGLIPNEDIQITYTGLRPGEKMHEELFYENEGKKSTSHKKIFIAKYPTLNANNINERTEKLIRMSEKVDNEMLQSLMKEYILCSGSQKDNVIPIKGVNFFEIK